MKHSNETTNINANINANINSYSQYNPPVLSQEQLVAQQQQTLASAPMRYSWIAKIFFFKMDLLTGKKVTLAKAKLLEILACVPYREWEIRQYARITRSFRNAKNVEWSQRVIEWGRSAQDNEYMHLQVVHEKMKLENQKDSWYLWAPITFFFVLSYVLISKTLAFLHIKGAFRFNAQFEDHAQHVYAQMVQEHPEWELQPVQTPVALAYVNGHTASAISENNLENQGESQSPSAGTNHGDGHPSMAPATTKNWADVFRQISADEKHHKEESLRFVE
jgi:ubiquinol oxidase